MPEPRVAIAGCGVISAAGGGTAALLAALWRNTSCLRPDARFAGPRFQSNLVGAAPIDSDSDDPALLLASTALQEARANSGGAIAGVPA